MNSVGISLIWFEPTSQIITKVMAVFFLSFFIYIYYLNVTTIWIVTDVDISRYKSLI